MAKLTAVLDRDAAGKLLDPPAAIVLRHDNESGGIKGQLFKDDHGRLVERIVINAPSNTAFSAKGDGGSRYQFRDVYKTRQKDGNLFPFPVEPTLSRQVSMVAQGDEGGYSDEGNMPQDLYIAKGMSRATEDDFFAIRARSAANKMRAAALKDALDPIKSADRQTDRMIAAANAVAQANREHSKARSTNG